MKNNWKKILNELSYRVSSGIPDLTNEQHLMKLWDILKEEKWPINARVELLKNLDEVSIVKNKKSGNVYPVKKFKPQTQTIVKKNATKDDIEKAKQGADEKDFDKSDTPQDKQTDDFEKAVDDKDNILLKEKNKEVNQDIDFEENPPESIAAEIDPTDEEFEGKKERGIIKEQTFDPDEIEVGGEKVKLPVTSEFLEKKFFPNPPHKIPKRYIKALERLLNTQKQGKSKPKITEFLNGVGAGEISPQASELITMMGTTLSDEQSEEFFSMIGGIADASGKPILDKDWMSASRAMRNTTMNNIREEFGDDAEVEFGGWDIPSDVEDGIGMEDYNKNKGFSTDAYFRVKDKDGKKHVHEVTLKKQLDAYLANLGSAKIEKALEEAGVDMGPKELQTGQLTKQQLNRSNDKVNGTTKEDIDEIVEMNQLNDEQLLERLSLLPSNIREKFTSGSPPNLKLNSDARDVINTYEKLKDIPLPWDTQDPEFKTKAKEAGINFGDASRTNKFAIFTGYLQHANELSKGIKDGKGFQFIRNQTGAVGDPPPPKGSGRDVANRHIENLAKPESKPIVMNIIREKFPLKSLMAGEEKMALGSDAMTPEICESIFGTTDYDKVQENLSVKEDKDGNYYLAYDIGVDGEEIRVGSIDCRQRGDGYASPTTGIQPTEEFKHRIHCANKKRKNPPKDYTDEEKKTIKRLNNKFGDCDNAKY